MAINMNEFKNSRKEFLNSKMTGAYYWSPSLKEGWNWNDRRDYWEGWNHPIEEGIPDDLELVGYEETLSYYKGRCYVDHKYHYYVNSKAEGANVPEIGDKMFGGYDLAFELNDWARGLGMDKAFDCRYEWDSSD